jgi:hypothetical protein
MENRVSMTGCSFKNHTHNFIAALDSLIIENTKISTEEFTKNLNDFIPCKNDYLKELRKAIECKVPDVIRIIHNNLFEESISKAIETKGCNAEGVNFITYEIFLYTISILLKEEQFDVISELLKREFSKSIHCGNNKPPIKTFKKVFYFYETFHEHGITYINNKKNLKYMRKDIDVLELVDADILIFLKTLIEEVKNHNCENEELLDPYWQPFTRIYIKFGNSSPFFKKCLSKFFFENLKIIFGCSLEENLDVVKSVIDRSKINNRFHCDTPIIPQQKLSEYININDLGTRE